MITEIVLGIVAVIVIFLLVLIIRALSFKPKKTVSFNAEEISIDREKAIFGLSEMIKCRTVSCRNRAQEDDAEFQKFRDLLPKLFPEAHKILSRELIGDRAILYRWAGKSSDKPVVLMSHYDVVSVVEENWTYPAFDGQIRDNELWGRGTLDTKVTLNGIMQAVEKLVVDGFVPQNDIYLSFSGNEEIAGTGTPMIVDYLEQKGIVPDLVVDEGGALVDKVFPGVTKTTALIGIAEKGMADIEFSIKGAGGHASSPPPHTAVGQLSSACVKIENSPMKSKQCKASRGLFQTMARNSNFVYKLIFANFGVFKPLFNKICVKKGGEMNALMRTTVAFTQMEGSKGANVLATDAKMVANVRIMEGDTVDSVVETFKNTIKNDNIRLKVLYGNNPSPSSEMTKDGYGKIEKAVLSTWGDVIVSPYLMIACSDSRHYCRISNKVFRFSAMYLTNEQRATIHGNDERIELDKIVKAVEFFTRLIKDC